MHRNLPKHYGKIAIGAALLAASVYFTMVSVTLAHLAAVSGQMPFDMRPFGYGPIDAAMLLDALGADGREYYLSFQIPLDTLYPALLALTNPSTNSFKRLVPGFEAPVSLCYGLANRSAAVRIPRYVDNETDQSIEFRPPDGT